MASRDTETGKVKDGKYADVLEEMLQRYERDVNEWSDIRAEGTTDMRYVSGDPWAYGDRRAREMAGRPVMSFDELGQYVNQLINEIRQHKRAIKVDTKGYGANDDEARLREAIIRQIEYQSNAQQAAYTPMFENTVQRSYGFLRVKAKFVANPEASGGSGASFDQELVLEGLPNPDLVTIDCDITKPDGSDMGHAWIAESWALADYKRKFPKAKVQDFSPELAKGLPKAWQYNQARIQVAEYWRKEYENRTLLLFSVDGQRALEVFEEDLETPAYAPIKKLMDDGMAPSRERVVERPIVKQFLTNGFEVLGQETVWPGGSIPIVCCFGKILYVDEGSGPKRKVLSLIRLARDPQMMVCYYRTTQAELVGMMGRFPYMIRRGSIKNDQMLLLQKSMHEPVAVIEVESSVEGAAPGFVPEMPVRNPFAPELERLEIGVEGARRAIQAAMGINPLPTSAQRKNEKSGVALKEIRNAEQQGSFHFIDSYEAALTRAGTILNELLPHYYDTPRDITTRTASDETKVVRINDEQQLAPGQDKPVTLTPEGQFDVTLSTGPSYASEREAASDFADNLAQNPQLMAILGPLVIKLKNLGPIGDEMVELLTAMAPPPVQAVMKKGQEGAPDPAQLMQQLEQASQMIDALSKELEAKTKVVETDQVKEVAETERKSAELAVKARLEEQKLALEKWIEEQKIALEHRKIEAQLEIEMAKLGSAQSMARAEMEQEALHAHGEQALKQQELQSKEAQVTLDRQAEQDEAERAREFESSENERNRQSASELAEKKTVAKSRADD